MGWSDVAQNRDKWQAVANTEINLRARKIEEITD
jgi:hypothetical protein